MVRHLIFRCPHCRSTTSARAEWLGAEPAEVACSSCDAKLKLAPGRSRGRNDQDYYERVKRYASDNSIDLASAYSVLEELMPRARVRTLHPTSPEIPRIPSTPLRSLALLGALLLGALLLGSYLRTSWISRPLPQEATRPQQQIGQHETRRDRGEEKQEPAPQLVPVLYQIDGQSKLTKVAASDPRSVLVAFCSQEFNGGAFLPYALAQATPPSPDVRMGFVRNRHDPGELRSVKIWLDRRSNRWTIGTGTDAVLTNPVADPPTDFERVF